MGVSHRRPFRRWLHVRSGQNFIQSGTLVVIAQFECCWRGDARSIGSSDHPALDILLMRCLDLALLATLPAVFSCATDLAANRAKWRERGYTDYDYEIVAHCLRCRPPIVGEFRVSVRRGVVTAATQLSRFPAPALEAFPTIDELFDLVGNANAQADRVHVEYDRGGIPSTVFIDWRRNRTDDEDSIRIRSFQAVGAR